MSSTSTSSTGAAAPAPATPAVPLRRDIAALPAYVPGARPQGEGIAKLSSNELPYPVQGSVLPAARVDAAAAHQPHDRSTACRGVRHGR